MAFRLFIALGSNLGDRQAYIEQSLRLLGERGVRLLKISSFLETEPFGVSSQGAFLNAVGEFDTELDLDQLLMVCQQVEMLLGRLRPYPGAPRTIDIDILLYGTERRSTDQLSVPHPRMRERSFVMIPLEEIAPAVAAEVSAGIFPTL